MLAVSGDEVHASRPRVGLTPELGVKVVVMRLLLLVFAIGGGLAAGASDRPVRPKPDAVCRSVADCAFTHFDEGCCFECRATVGSRRWVDAVERICSARAEKGCRVPACGQANVRLECVAGRCVNR